MHMNDIILKCLKTPGSYGLHWIKGMFQDATTERAEQTLKQNLFFLYCQEFYWIVSNESNTHHVLIKKTSKF